MKKAILVCGVGGLIFASYLSAVKLFGNTCALGEACPYFLGYPACYFGFVMYLFITIFAVVLVLGIWNERKILGSLIAISFLGVLFAGYFTINEIPILYSDGLSAFALGLPTCAWGLIFYVVIFTLSTVLFFKKTHPVELDGENNNPI